MKVVATNRKAFHDYTVSDNYEAGMVLEGSEVKSLRDGSVSLSDSYADFRKGEIYLFNLHITPYKCSSFQTPDPKRRRKLLLTKREIRRLYGQISQRGSSLVPLKIYFNDRGFAKVTLGLCQHKRQYDKKEKMLKEEDRQKISRLRKAVR
jgi:SsrA-binding protein